MDAYIEVRLLPDPEFAPTLLMNALCTKLHRAFVQLKSENIGISFPDYSDKPAFLGNRLRLHSHHERLEEFMTTSWQRGMRDHLRVGSICETPSHATYAVFSRKQVRSNVERIRRRQMQRHSLTYEEACNKIPESREERLTLPFISMKSSSTGQQFRLFIERKELEAQEMGQFNAYGLSGEAAVPLF